MSSQPRSPGRSSRAARGGGRGLLIVACASLVACRAPLTRTIDARQALESTIQPAVPAATPSASAAGPPIERCGDATASPLPAAIDDFQQPARRKAWFTYSDPTPEGTLEQGTEEIAPGQRALHVTADGWRDWGAGVGVQLGAAVSGERRRCEVDASAYDGVRFRARGRGSLRVNLTTTPLVSVAEGGTCDLGERCHDFPGAEVRLTPAWTTVELRFCGLTPVGWGRTTAALDLTRAVALHFRMAENESHDLWLDDLALIPRGAARAGERCGPTCPLAATTPGAIITPALLSPGHASAGLTIHTFEQATKSCGPLTRRYLTYVPRRLAARTSAPIVIALHGWGSSAESFRDFQTHAGFEPLADRDGFIVVYGNAAPGSATSVRVPNSGAWRQPRTADDEVDDVAYLDTVLDDLRSRQIVDGSNRVFLVGQSNGGGMVIEAARLRPNRYTGFAAMMPFAGLSPASPAVLDVGHLSRILFAYSATDPGLPAGYVSTLRPLADRWAAALGFSPAAIAAPTRTALVDRVHEGDGYEGSLPAALATRRSHGEQLDLRAAGAPASAPALRILAFDHAGHFWPHPTQDTLPFILEKWGLRNQDLDAADAVWSFFKDAAPGR